MTFLPAICTFYSFKGGVGRSMAALNVAYALVARGHRVLLVDFDLEAPGLSYFLQRQGEIGDRTSYSDAVDLLAWARQVAVQNPDGAQDPDWVEKNGPSLFRFVSVLPQDKLQPLLRPLGTLGSLHVLPADTERDYVSRLADLRLAELTRDQLFAMSAALRGQFQRHRLPIDVPTYYGTHGELMVPYDFVLLDSRTGFNELGGLCVGPVADRLIVLTGLNDQNLAGTRLALETLGVLGQPDSPEPWDDMVPPPGDPFCPPFLGKKPTLIVASPVPVIGSDSLKPRLQLLQDTLGAPPAVQLSYHPQLALRERVFVRDEPQEPLSAQYRQLAESLEAALNLHPNQYKPGDLESDPGRQLIQLQAALRVARQDPRSGLLLLQPLAEQSQNRALASEDHAQLFDQLMATLTQSPIVSAVGLYLRVRVLLKWRERSHVPRQQEQLLLIAKDLIAQALLLPSKGPRLVALLHCLRGICELGEGHPSEALAEINAWIGSLQGTDRGFALGIRARAHMAVPQDEKALQDLREILSMPEVGTHSRFTALGNSAIIFQRAQMFKEALAALSEALLLEGEEPAERGLALRQIIQVHAQIGDLPNAQARFAELEKQHGVKDELRADALLSLGWGAYLLKRYEDAVTWSRQAVALHPMGPACVAQANLGLALLQLGRTSEAHGAYRAFADQCVIDAVLDAALKDLDEAVAAQADLAGVAEARELLLAQKHVVADLSRRAAQAATLARQT
jgi:tetratricopeptide (TPR) repeat protein